ncbi:MAG: hypothetical protein A2V66_03680 [Ignavibacteria bacterium RBG_13_36_8]|nr:MAG: hypothetical protein A2V66_03680 [Ignavibacteria bacterium RBG_13_36_8]
MNIKTFLITLILFTGIANAQIATELTVAMDSAASLSGIIDAGDRTPIAIQIDTAWTAADLTFQTCNDTTGGTNWRNVNFSGLYELQFNVSASGFYLIDPKEAEGFLRYIKVRSGTSAAAVNQAAARTIYLWVR